MKIFIGAQEDILINNVSIENDAKYKEVFRTITEGVYLVNLEYQAIGNYKVCCGSENSYPSIYGEEHWLKASETIKEFRFWVNGKIDAPYILIEHDNTNGLTEGFSLSVKSIRIARQYRESLLYSLLKVAAVLGTVDMLFFVYLKRCLLRKHAYVILGLLFIFFISSLGVFSSGQALGHDLYFHLARIRGIAEAVMTGEFPVKMQPEWFNGYGYPVSVFYGDVLLYIPAVLYMLNIPLEFCYKIYVLLINLGTTLISYFCFKNICKDKYISLTGTAIYTLSVSRIINVYLRAAVGEYSAAMFLPLIAFAVYEILTSDIKGNKYRRNWIFLCFGITGVIYTHIISVEITGIFLVIISLINIKKILQKETIRVLLKSTVITIFLNLGFLLPFLDYSRESLQIFSEKDFYGIQSYGLSLYELFSISSSGVGKALPSSAGLNGRIPISLGCAVLLVLVLVAFAMVGRNFRDSKEGKAILQLLGLAVIAGGFSTCYFPWNQLSNIKLFQNIVASIQFPWRFITVCILFVIMAMTLVLVKWKSSLVGKRIYVLSAVLCIVSAYQGMQYADMVIRNMDSSMVYDGEEMMDSGIVLEYVYVGTDVGSVMTDNRIHGENIDIMRFDRSGNYMNVAYKSKKNAFLELPLFAYPYYQCRDAETEEKFTIEKSMVNSRIRIHVPDDYEGSVDISFVQPWYWRVAEAVSCISFLAVVIYAFTQRKDIFGFRGI